MRASKNSMIGFSIFTIGFLPCLFLSDNEMFINIIISCLTGCIVGIINSYILYVDEFKSQLNNYLIDIINLMRVIEKVKKRKLEYTFINYDLNYNELKYIYDNLIKLISWLNNVIVLDNKAKVILNKQKEELYKFYNIIDEDCYYIYSLDDVETHKILMIDVIEKIQHFNFKNIYQLIIKSTKLYNCMKRIIDFFITHETKYNSINILTNTIFEKNKGTILIAKKLENEK